MTLLVRFQNPGPDVGGVAICIMENDFRVDPCTFGGAQHCPPMIAGSLLQQQNLESAA
jgi:hypothetical protein